MSYNEKMILALSLFRKLHKNIHSPIPFLTYATANETRDKNPGEKETKLRGNFYLQQYFCSEEVLKGSSVYTG